METGRPTAKSVKHNKKADAASASEIPSSNIKLKKPDSSYVQTPVD